MYLADADFEKLYQTGKSRKNPLDNRFIAMSNAILKALPSWQLEAKKLFFLCLSQYQFNSAENPNIIVLNKKDVIEKLEINSSKGGAYIRYLAQKMVEKSFVKRTISHTPEGDVDLWDDGNIFIGSSSTKTTVSIKLNPDFQAQFQALSAKYTMLWCDDLIKISTTQTMKLYEELRRIYDTRYLVNKVDFNTKQLKELFGLTKDDYMRKKDGFNRSEFEKKCLDKAINEINEKCEAIQIMIHENGKGYEKTKQFGGKIDKYVIQYRCATRVVDNEITEKANSDKAIKLEYDDNQEQELQRLRLMLEEASIEPAEGQFDIYDYLNKGETHDE